MALKRLFPRHRLPLVVGCTASGKTALGIHVCEALASRGFDTPSILNCDALQVYRGVNIGVAKATAAEQAQTPHYLLDCCDPDEVYDVKQWELQAVKLVESLPCPVVVGGSHMYIRALLQGLFEFGPADPAFRRQLEELSVEELFARLVQVDPDRAGNVHRNDRSRVIRALEVHKATGIGISALQRQWKNRVRYPTLLVHMVVPRAILHRRINTRVNAMVVAGLVDEVYQLWESGKLGRGVMSGIGYKELVHHFEGRCTLADALERIRINTRRLAKHQRKWVRKLATLEGVKTLELRCDAWEEARDVLDAPVSGRHFSDAKRAQQHAVDDLMGLDLPLELWAEQVADALLLEPHEV